MYQFKSTYTVYIHITHIKLCLLRAIFNVTLSCNYYIYTNKMKNSLLRIKRSFSVGDHVLAHGQCTNR